MLRNKLSISKLVSQPSNVELLGQVAGIQNILYMLKLSRSQPLFHRKQIYYLKKKFAILILVLNTFLSYAQNFTPAYQSNNSFDFNTFLSGVKDAEMYTTPEQEQFIMKTPIIMSLFRGVSDYLRGMGFETVGYSHKFNSLKPPSFCDKTTILINYNTSGYFIVDFTITFKSCKDDSWTFKSNQRIPIKSGSVADGIHNALIKMYGYKRPNYYEPNRIKLISQTTSWTETKLKSHFITEGVDAIEGIYENTTSSQGKYVICIIKKDDGYDLVYLKGADNYLDWKEGDIKAKLTRTATPSMFKGDWYLANKKMDPNFYISFETGLMNVIASDNSKSLYIKLYPTISDNALSSNNLPASGTGFAITTNGLIATNYHVINGATKIIVRGINNDFTKTYKAKIIIEDKNNDLAIIQIDDPFFTTLGNIPYIINGRSSDVGSSIFILGYPLRASMGDEIKLTNGIISSKSGFQGDITSYQITAPVQPGNSGGPLFDENGNIIGIVNAKHLGAENASYAVKSSYLFNLIDLMPTTPDLQKVSMVNTKPLTEQVKILKKYTYIIEVN